MLVAREEICLVWAASVMYGSEWDKSLVVNSPRFVKSTLTTVEHLVEVTNMSASVPEGPLGEAPKGVAGGEAGEDEESSQVQSQVVVQRSWMTPEQKSRKGPKVRWGQEVMVEVAREELRLVGQNVRLINVELHRKFQSRTLEAIKGMRRQEKYKSLLTSLAAPPPSGNASRPRATSRGYAVSGDGKR